MTKRSKRFRITLGLVLVAIVCVFVFLWNASHPSESVYEGKPLSRWMEGYVPTSGASPPFNSPGWSKADEALHRIGTNGIPTLLRMIRAKDPPKPMLKCSLAHCA